MKNIFNLIKNASSDEFNRGQWEKSNPFGKNFMNPDDYDKNSPGYHIIEVTPNVSNFFKVPGKNYEEAWEKWMGSYSNSKPEESEYYDSSKDYSDRVDYWGRVDFE
jgi:hypothetical protein|tara:strand:- start:1917 stop:2234 length:318 start_codon:yes stop_codon:yes gene_type:complete